MTGLTIDHQTWILVADGEKALFLENTGDATLPNFAVRRVEEHENPPDREQGTDKPGRMADDAPGSHRSSVAETDWHEIEKDRFAREVADILYKMAHRNRFKKMVIVAPPHILGDLRQEMHKEVADRVVGELPKTLTNHPIDKIENLLAA
ncbi:host attachment family protein [Aurantimonas sp. VKM B-3413]|uniref:host attachment family protein n=1 Tax=Aurantimonas sp. VKM B-3413 TaxID=2779401 RepID=UPI001E50C7F7|nr:host attachment family protein [Aurantimonas sp. VKM B-3413]MCB8838107.1 host attachment family protein [Aurantimonas sp. VKM B-3413]